MKIGSNNALDLFTSGRNFNAQDAKKIGLIKTISTDDDIDNLISKEIKTFLVNAPSAISASKSS